MEWIKIVLSRIHKNKIWLENGPIRISKRIIHRVIGYSTLDKLKTLRSDAKEVIEKNTRATWNKRGMSIDKIEDLVIVFVVRVIVQIFYQSRQLNSVSIIFIELGYKLIKKDHIYDLVEL